MASPHAAGVAALIVSQFGKLAKNGDVELAPSTVESILERSAVDIGLTGYDTCFGNGRIDALRAIEQRLLDALRRVGAVLRRVHGVGKGGG